MKKEEVAYIGCRLVGLFYAIKALETVASFVMTFVAWKTASAQFSTSVSGMFCLLWFGSATIVKYLLPDSEIKHASKSVTAEQIQSVAFSAVGLLVLTWGIADLGNVLFQLFQLKQTNDFAHIPLTLQAAGVAVACRLLLGFCLVFGSRGLSGFFTRLRQPELR